MRNFILIILLVFNGLSYQSGDRYKNDVIELKEDLSIGVANGAEEYMFANPSYVDADSKGNIYVADAMDKVIKVFNPEGKYLKSIGGSGQGPGEFQRLYSIIIDKNDFIHVYDVGLRRLTIFNQNGKFEKSYPFNGKGKNVISFFIDKNDNFIVKEQVRSHDETGIKDEIEINLYSKELLFVRTIFKGEEKIANVIRNNQGVLRFTRAYPYTIHYSFIPDGKIVYGRNDTYDFYIHSLEDNTTKETSQKYKPVRISKEEETDYFKGRIFTNPRPGYKKKEIKNGTFFPKEKPPFSKIIVDDTGYIIFVTYREDKKKGIECDLWDFEGNFLKKIYFKKSLLYSTRYSQIVPRILKFKKDYIYGIIQTEEGWAKAVRFTINQ